MVYAAERYCLRILTDGMEFVNRFLQVTIGRFLAVGGFWSNFAERKWEMEKMRKWGISCKWRQSQACLSYAECGRNSWTEFINGENEKMRKWEMESEEWRICYRAGLFWNLKLGTWNLNFSIKREPWCLHQWPSMRKIINEVDKPGTWNLKLEFFD